MRSGDRHELRRRAGWRPRIGEYEGKRRWGKSTRIRVAAILAGPAALALTADLITAKIACSDGGCLAS